MDHNICIDINNDSVKYRNVEELLVLLENSKYNFKEVSYEIMGYEGKKYIINRIIKIVNLLTKGAILIIYVKKKYGAKSFMNILQNIFSELSWEKKSNTYIFKITKINEIENFYDDEIEIYLSENICSTKIDLFSVAGLFSYKKMDEGSKEIVKYIKRKEIIKKKWC